MTLNLFDTHNHFDDAVFDEDRLQLTEQAYKLGIKHMLITGITQATFKQILAIQQHLNQSSPIITHSALGLHPLFVHQHTQDDLHQLDTQLSDNARVSNNNKIIAIGEVGLDTYNKPMKHPDILRRQQDFFIAQLDLAVKYQLPVLLHIRKAHAESLHTLKAHAKSSGYDAHQLGGIAHSFSGGEQEAKAFIKLGFKLGITGQICHPNAKKLRRTVQSAVAEFGLNCLVLETDCPDMLPQTDHVPSDVLKKLFAKIPAHHIHLNSETSNTINDKSIRNTPSHLLYILATLSDLLLVEPLSLCQTLWSNSFEALRLTVPAEPSIKR